MSIVAQGPRFCQTNPLKTCRYNTTNHRDWRCSLECYRNAAFKECESQLEVLRTIDVDMHIYFGTLAVSADLSEPQVRKSRKDFLKTLRSYCKEHGIQTCELRGITEVGAESGRHHHHYCMFTSETIEQDRIRELWSAVSPASVTVRVSHKPPVWSVKAASNYMWKYARRFTPSLPLLGSMEVTWGTRRFFGKGGKVARWKDAMIRKFGGPNDADFFSD